MDSDHHGHGTCTKKALIRGRLFKEYFYTQMRHLIRRTWHAKYRERAFYLHENCQMFYCGQHCRTFT